MPHWLKICLGGLGGASAGGLLMFLLFLLHAKLNGGSVDFKPYRDDDWYGGCANAVAGVGLLMILLLLGAVLGGIGGAMLAARW